MGTIFNGKFRVTSGYKLPDRPDHNGIDMVGDEDNRVLSASNGIVNQIQYWDGVTKTGMQSYGNLIIVKGNDNHYYYYAHLKSINVSNGQSVSIGTNIGIMGTTGNSTGNHTHFEIRDSDKSTRLNPATYLGIPNAKGTYYSKDYESIESNKRVALKGVDVSKYQGEIDWEKAKESGMVQFAILRAGYGMYESQIDPTFERNYSECKRLGIPVGTYWYTYATSTEQAKKETQVYLKALEGKTTELPNFLDMEYEPNIKALSKQLRTDICKTFMKEIENAGFKSGLYCSRDWIQNWLYKNQLTGYDKWIAEYGTSCKYTDSDLCIWQYTSKGSVPGISGNVDLDYCYKNYTSVQGSGSWKKNSKGWWWEYPDGTYPTDKWLKIDNRWYWFNKSGYCVKGYQTIDGKKYYFAEDYAMGYIKECQLIMTDKNGEIL